MFRRNSLPRLILIKAESFPKKNGGPQQALTVARNAPLPSMRHATVRYQDRVGMSGKELSNISFALETGMVVTAEVAYPPLKLE